MVRHLLSCGADPNEPSWSGQCALHLAALSGNIALTDLLLTSGASVECRDRNGLSALHYAVDSGRVDVVEWLLPRAKQHLRDNQGWTPLHRAVMQAADPKIIEVLMSQGLEPETRDFRGLTCAQLASMSNKREEVQRLVDINFVRGKVLGNFSRLAKKFSVVHALMNKS